ncbi:MAG: hypothetical protein ACLT3D_08245 [Lawsonibacter sp.]
MENLLLDRFPGRGHGDSCLPGCKAGRVLSFSEGSDAMEKIASAIR